MKKQIQGKKKKKEKEKGQYKDKKTLFVPICTYSVSGSSPPRFSSYIITVPGHRKWFYRSPPHVVGTDPEGHYDSPSGWRLTKLPEGKRESRLLHHVAFTPQPCAARSAFRCSVQGISSQCQKTARAVERDVGGSLTSRSARRRHSRRSVSPPLCSSFYRLAMSSTLDQSSMVQLATHKS